LKFGFEASPIAVSVLLDLIDPAIRCFAHTGSIDGVALPPQMAIGYS
jgi:hypothetical protein